MFRVLTTFTGAAALAMAVSAHASPVADFYSGKTITIIVSQGAGGGYARDAQLLTRHMPRHIPGEPTMVLQFMPGAAGVTSTNYVYNVAAKDGTVMGMPPYALAQIQVLHGNVRYDAARFHYIGRMANVNGMLMVSDQAPATTLDGIRKTEIVIASGGRSGQSYITPALMSSILGLRFKIVTGYPGSAEMDLAIERGEAHGRVGNWSNYVTEKAHLLEERKIIPLIEVGLDKSPKFPEVPLLSDLAANDDDRAILEFMSAGSAMGRVFVLPPDVPEERVKALRRAFDATMKDPEFLADAERSKTLISPMTGEELQRIVERAVSMPSGLVERARAAIK
jgi:tripartite-type tricarboxylate transporter receptor subunit TctC